MIVLGPMNADLGGAPAYWRQGNWRPPGVDRQTEQGSLALTTSIPFDRCDLVLEYDARDLKRPLPGDQGWDLKSSGGEPMHEAELGALRFDVPEGEILFFSGETRIRLENIPEYAVFYVLFTREDDRRAEQEDRREDATIIGWDAQILLKRQREPFRGLRATWGDRFLYRELGNGTAAKQIDASVPHDTLTEVWHSAAIDGQMRGIRSRRDSPFPDDGGKTIGSLDHLINNEDRAFFGAEQSAAGPARFVARFGKTDPRGTYRGRIRRFVASAPGRRICAEFRAAAPGKSVRVRLILYADIPEDGTEGSAAFTIRYASGASVRPNEIPRDEVTISRQFDATNFHRIVEAAVDLRPFTAGAPFWFSVERDWQNRSDTLTSTVHLLQVILEAR
jgi:hypothetical protein